MQITRSLGFALIGASALGAVGLVLTRTRRRQHARYTPADLVGALHGAFGQHHARAVHAKGIVLEGTFDPDPGASRLTRAAHMQQTRSRVLVRFSDFTGLPDIADNDPTANPRGFAVRFALPDGRITDIVGHSYDGFPAATSDEFHDLLIALATSGPGTPAPTPLERFLEDHPAARRFATEQKTPESYATIGYFGVNAFRLTNIDGMSRFVRYQFAPEAGERLLSPDAAMAKSAMYLQDEIRARVAAAPIRFRMYAQIAEPEDVIDDPSTAWPEGRQKVFLGTIELTRLGANTSDEDRALALTPTRLLDGIEPADPMIRMRGDAYPISVAERQ